MKSELLDLVRNYGEKILRGKYSTKRIMSLCGVNKEDAKEIRKLAKQTQRGEDLGVVHDPEEYISKKRVWHDKETDTYITYLPGLHYAIEIAGSMHREILDAYSNYDTNPSTIAQLEQTFSFPREWLIKYLKVHGVTHDSLPFTDQEFFEKSERDLADIALARIKSNVHLSVSKKRLTEQKRQAQKWKDFEGSVLNPLLATMRKKIPEYVPLELNAKGLKKSSSPFSLAISPTDLHWGKFGTSGKEKYNKRIAEERLFRASERLLTRVLKHGLPEKAYISVGSDWFHVDTPYNTTTKGTPQDTDGNWEEIFTTGCELCVKFVDLIRQLCPVELVLMAGNHDWTSSISLLWYLYAWYNSCDDVVTHKSTDPRYYVKYGNSLLGFTHGDQIKRSSLGQLMAIEAKKFWGAVDHRHFFTGHLHYEKVEDVMGVMLYQMPSLSGSDRWHVKKGYVGSVKNLVAYIVDKKEGVIASFYAPQ